MKGSQIEHLPLVRRSQLEPGARAPGEGPVRWLTLVGRPVAAGNAAPTTGIRLHPLRAGNYQLPLTAGPHSVDVVELWVARGGRAVKLEEAAPTIAQHLPALLGLASEDEEVLTDEWVFVLCGRAQALPSTISLTSLDASEGFVDRLGALPLTSAPRVQETSDPGLDCAQTAPLRLAPDLVDKNHPLLAQRTLVAQVGGSLFIEIADR